jgi:UDP-N-acetylmuramoyl-tripeptide--D-alanyl-D-alanine ligase
MNFTVKKLCEICHGELWGAGVNNVIEYLTTDTREIGDDKGKNSRCLFLALKGERFDGNSFAEEMYKKGVGAVICSLPKDEVNAIIGNTGEGFCGAIIVAEDTLKALGDIGRAFRKEFEIPVAAVTGSVGKTSTKEAVAAVLSQKYVTLKTKANFNNEIGLPKTLLGLDNEHQAAVVEMGMRGLGEIEYLANIALPDICIITNIGVAHMELLGSRENIFRAKLEIGGVASCKTLILNGDDEFLREREKVEEVLAEYGNSPKLIYYGTGVNCAVRAVNIEETALGYRFLLRLPDGNEAEAETMLPGIHHVYNALAAAACGFLLELSAEEIVKGIAGLSPDNAVRQKIEKYDNGITVIDDTYNAGPESMKASLGVLAGLAKRSDVKNLAAALGDMLELGAMSEISHRQVGEAAADAGVTTLITVGTLSKSIAEGYLSKMPDGKVLSFGNSEDAAKKLSAALTPGCAVLVKGSHAMNMSVITAAVKKFTWENNEG